MVPLNQIKKRLPYTASNVEVEDSNYSASVALVSSEQWLPPPKHWMCNRGHKSFIATQRDGTVMGKYNLNPIK